MIEKKLLIPALILELGAVCFMVLSIVTVFSDGEYNWYLPLALGLNCISIFMGLIARKRQRRNEEKNK